MPKWDLCRLEGARTRTETVNKFYWTRHKQNKNLIRRWKYPNVTWRVSSYLLTYLGLFTDGHWTGTCTSDTSPHDTQRPLYSSQFATYRLFAPITHPMDHTLVISTVDNWIWTWIRKIYSSTLMRGLPRHLPGNVIFDCWPCLYKLLTCSPNSSFLSRLVSGSS